MQSGLKRRQTQCNKNYIKVFQTTTVNYLIKIHAMPIYV